MYGSTYDQPATTRVPDGETDYLAKAAALLKDIADQDVRGYRRMEVADKYTLLGAIQRGQFPAAMAKQMFEQLNAKA